MSIPNESTFYCAVEHIIQGNEEKLTDILNQFPTLIGERSPSPHNATLLHYVAANGVEDKFQLSPTNAARITEILLNAGADVNALAKCYGGGPAQTTLSLLVSSYPPFKAGVQVPITRTLIDSGAKINGINNEGGPIATAIAFGYSDVAAELAKLGARIECVQIAAALGDMQATLQFFEPQGKLLPNAGDNNSNIIPTELEPEKALDSALWYACLHDQVSLAEFLLSNGAALTAKGPEGFTALHSAAVRGSTRTLDFLLDNDAPMEVTNDYGGTPLDTLCWFANNIKNNTVDYIAIASQLIEHGASTSAISPYPTGLKKLDDLIKIHRD